MRRGLLIPVLALVAAACAATTTSAAPGGLQTAIFDPDVYASDKTGLAFRRTRAAGASMVRLSLRWEDVAPRGHRPEDFNPGDPNDAKYKWAAFDAQVNRAVAAGLVPIVVITSFPDWVQRARGVDGAGRPDARELAVFAGVAAQRFDGSDPGRPRVRYWQIWNEPNISIYLSPQRSGSKLVAPSLYRQMLNLAARRIHTVKSDNVVIAGGLSPFTRTTGPVDAVGPLRFMRQLLSRRVELDVWAHHPYTSGGPTRSALNPDDVSLGDLGEMRDVLNAAVRAGRVHAPRGVGFWVTEFSWDTNGPDPDGVPVQLHARWVAEALYRMWAAGVSVVTWFTLRDEPLRRSSYQAGLYFRGRTLAADKPKPALQAFRFPFVAFVEPRGVRIWGRTPASKAGRVAIERRSPGGSWRSVVVLSANRFGIVSKLLSVPVSTTDSYRARTADGASLPFSLTRPPDMFVRPFGR